MVKYRPEIFDKSSTIPEKDGVIDKLINFLDIRYLQQNPELIEYDIKLWVFLIRHGNEILKEKNRMNLLVKNCISILLNDCGGKGELIGQKNLQRVINMLSLLIAISGQYKEESQNMKEIVELIIVICKEKRDLLRKNAAILLARIAKSSNEMEDFVRSLHGMEVLVNISKFIDI